MGLLEGKVIIVTGAGRGVGRCIALEAAREGAMVVVNDLGGDESGAGGDAGPAQSVADEITAAGGQAIADGGSVAQWDSARAIVERTVRHFGRLDGLVNNAGILRDRIFHKMDPESFEAVVQVHLLGSFYMSRAAADLFRAQNSGAFVHMTSTSGLIGNFGQANYMAAKLGIVGLSKAIAMDMARFGVRSNCIAPFAWTRLVGTIPDATEEEKARVEGLKKLRPELIAPFPVALLSDDAKAVTGQVFGTRANEIFLFSQSRPVRSVHADGGWTPQTVIERAVPAMAPSFYPLERSGDVFTWDPV
ncbi:NAD(P)-dependent dehydrogenase, short-chain alcohol dehydrogenase family [Tistlia consotensis]|uniref:NAD(P)-dependent dehydrogenase, short-chain alcohol dehydrogenase family n=1 Tax=Tistlia consotensis USBA 355 TaxID=560819 RepID=A0A1Y6CHN1_9PROT|nr:SDR family NAD(P)-dependent oxidoreductase [Tistlia consotensis]SMF66059.1 NAD(P)-dependent dehydrogenase, short-chain alcohol dehydrogenase family [Tistlia consotensis USBA 355]SNS02758.1 NAD(P)-dependent dehydrogenase, short-chain alcohol dehydrogenase family [Tistlia consotensis]